MKSPSEKAEDYASRVCTSLKLADTRADSVGAHKSTYLAGYTEGQKYALELAKELSDVHDELLDWLRGGSNCPHCALATVKIGKAITNFKRREGG